MWFNVRKLNKNAKKIYKSCLVSIMWTIYKSQITVITDGGGNQKTHHWYYLGGQLQELELPAALFD